MLSSIRLGSPLVRVPVAFPVLVSFLVLVALTAVLGLAVAAGPTSKSTPGDESPNALFDAGHFAEAYTGYRAQAVGSGTNSRLVKHSVEQATACLQRLRRVSEQDALWEATVAAHPQDVTVLWAVAELFLRGPSHGYMVAGEFERGSRRGGGQFVRSGERDRVRALQLFERAREIGPAAEARADLQFAAARAWVLYRQGHQAWRLQELTDLGKLPDFQPGYQPGSGSRGAPVAADGSVVQHRLPSDWARATTDGERWRFLLARSAETSDARRDEARFVRAEFLQSQFGVQTMVGYDLPRPEETGEDESGPYAVQSLTDGETIARLATGVRRFSLAPEFNAIELYGEISKGTTPLANESLARLAQIHENRRQYPRAAAHWRTLIERTDDSQKRDYRERLEQIVGHWGRFEPVLKQPAGTGANVMFRFRNARSVELTAQVIQIEKLLEDVKEYIRSKPDRLNWQKINVGNLGHRIVVENQERYCGEEAARWTVPLDPHPEHRDRQISLTTPLQAAGAYLLTAKLKDGNTSHVVVWLNDTVIVTKRMSGATHYFVADARTGSPIPGAELELFAYQQRRESRNVYRIDTLEQTRTTDTEGQVVLTSPDGRFTSLATVKTQAGRLAYLGFQGIWRGRYDDSHPSHVKIFGITDRPVYRPEQVVHFKCWLDRPSYERDGDSEYSGRAVAVKIRDPKNQEVVNTAFTCDRFGGFEGEYTLPVGAPLGQYWIEVEGQWAGRFRVEEYKKPEFEVTVKGPDEPIQLGEKFKAQVTARYYYGAPVTEGRVKVKVLRSSTRPTWFPPGRWDWLYGSGYGWVGQDHSWYPGWASWGCKRPFPWWWSSPGSPPEVVVDQELALGPDGTVEIEVDSAVALALHGDQDHRYRITAEVVDASRRTIVGTGSALAARHPFKVYVWTDRGYYDAGQTARVSLSARTPDGKPVKGKGELRLLQVTYPKDEPQETLVESWPLELAGTGPLEHTFVAARSGQYRLSYTLTDDRGRNAEGGYLFSVIGQDLGAARFRYNALELIPDRTEVAPGDRVELLVQTDRPGSTVVLFERPVNGIYLIPKILTLRGQQERVFIDVKKKDMPNFFVEAYTISDGELHRQSRLIVVPPEKRMLEVAVRPSASEYLPGEQADVELELKDERGQPFEGTAVISIYDRAVEYIAGGSNVPGIRAHFWSWRRTHHPAEGTNLRGSTGNQVPPGEHGMANLGVFGRMIDTRFGGSGGRLQGRTRSAKKASPSDGGELASGMLDLSSDDGIASDEEDAAETILFEGTLDASSLVEATVRKEFADTALWKGAITTNSDGLAKVSLDMPENLTSWKIRVWGMGRGTRVGEAQTEVVTRKNLVLRLQAPRFFTQKDRVTLSANVHNYLETEKQVRVSLELDGDTLAASSPLTRDVKIAPQGETRVDWTVDVLREGEAVVRMLALTDEESDAMELRFPVHVHGMLKTEAVAGSLRRDLTSVRVPFVIPAERRVEASRVELRYSPTIAGALVDALPYLANYPHGCTEQTLNRFLPTVVVQKVLMDLGFDLDAIRDKRTNLNPQEIGDSKSRAAGWKRFEENPVFDGEVVSQMVSEGLKALLEMQLSDGGWGWFSGWGERSYPHTTATVVHGLLVARANDVSVPPRALDRGLDWLASYEREQIRRLQNAPSQTRPYKRQADNLDALVYSVLAEADQKSGPMRDFLYRDRTHLSTYGLALFGLALHSQSETEKLSVVQRNVAQFLEQDDENDTAWLRVSGASWWNWYGDEIEADATYLKLLTRVDPQGSVAPRLAKYIVNNRKHATYWKSTRDTSLCIEALAEYFSASGEGRPDQTVEVWFGGEKKKEVHITADNLFSFDGTFVLTGDQVPAGAGSIELRRRGKGPLYYNLYVTNFTLEDSITRAGLEIKVDRRFYRLVPEESSASVSGDRGQALRQKAESYRREPLDNLALLKSGDLVEVELILESKNDYEYLIFEDMKAAGFEAVDVRSGYRRTGFSAYMELRDRSVNFFVRRLLRGRHSLSYRLRAEIPGQFSALPTLGHAMYAPELRANSDEMKLRVED